MSFQSSNPLHKTFLNRSRKKTKVYVNGLQANGIHTHMSIFFIHSSLFLQLKLLMSKYGELSKRFFQQTMKAHDSLQTVTLLYDHIFPGNHKIYIKELNNDPAKEIPHTSIPVNVDSEARSILYEFFPVLYRFRQISLKMTSTQYHSNNLGN